MTTKAITNTVRVKENTQKKVKGPPPSPGGLPENIKSKEIREIARKFFILGIKTPFGLFPKEGTLEFEKAFDHLFEENLREKTPVFLSLFDYLGFPAGFDLGRKVYEIASKRQEVILNRPVNTKSYQGSVRVYRKQFLEEILTKNGILKV